jgi:hypothetical protein
MWVEARIMMSKTYLVNKEIDKAIKALNDICFILPSFPLKNMLYIKSVLEGEQENEDEEMNMDDDNDRKLPAN